MDTTTARRAARAPSTATSAEDSLRDPLLAPASEVASQGVAASGSTMPHARRIQDAFGRHDVSGVRAHVGGGAASAADALGAEAYAHGDDVAFGGAPDLFTAAHEAAHVVQQQAGVQLLGGFGTTGDAHERNADAVAEAVVRGESAEPLLDAHIGSGAAPATANPPVQLYHKAGAARVSDGGEMVVVDNGGHNTAYVTQNVLQAGQNGLKQGTKIALQAGAAFDPVQHGVDPNDLAGNLVEAKASQVAGQDEQRQRQGAIDLSTQYKQGAQTQMEKLAKPSLWQKFTKQTPDVDLSGFDVDAQIHNNPAVKKKVVDTYKTLAKANTFDPATVRKVAEKNKVPTKVTYYLMNQISEYHGRVLDEYGNGGFTTPNDCGEVAKNFVLGSEIKASQGGGEGYPYHFFSMVFSDGSDRISLENAVGGDNVEQIWKKGAFDADWHWEMRGTDRPNDEQGEAFEEMHGVGLTKSVPSQNFRNNQDQGRLNLQDKMRGVRN